MLTEMKQSRGEARHTVLQDTPCCKAESAQVGLTAVGGLRHPQHNQISSKSSTIAADSSNGVTNTR